jgi:hypothetical protein
MHHSTSVIARIFTGCAWFSANGAGRTDFASFGQHGYRRWAKKEYAFGQARTAGMCTTTAGRAAD